MKASNRLILLVVGLSVSACSIKPITVESIRATPTYKVSFSVDRPYQQVFADLLDNTRECFSRKPTQDQLFVTGKKNNGNKIANIQVVYVYGKLEQNVHFMMDLKSESSKKTTVTAYTSERNASGKVNAVKLWANNESKACTA